MVAALIDASLDYMPTSVADSDLPLPGDFALHQNYPNPFNPETVISYQLQLASDVQLTIYNAIGQEVRTLVHGCHSPGLKAAVWDGKNDRSRSIGEIKNILL